MRAAIILICILMLVGLLFLIGCAAPASEEVDALASCLTENGAVMYGANWCPHCAEQKEMFNASFSKINYVECEEQKQKCADAGITGLPTWKFADGSILQGKQEFSVLAKKAGCPWPFWSK
jgi:hypothetical protein